jgi:nucleotide-binding universal stress UspA family protein
MLAVIDPPEGTTVSSHDRNSFSLSGDVSGITASGLDLRTSEPVDPVLVETEGQAIQRVIDERKEALARYAAPLHAAGLEIEYNVVLGDDAAETIIRFAREHRPDFIAMATHGRSGLNQLVQGSVASEVVRSGVAPVVLVRPNS